MLLQHTVLCKKTLLLMITAVFILILIFSMSGTHAEAHIVGEKQLKTIVVAEGDTLWDIAKDYHTELDGDLTSYVDEIKRTNGLQSDVIQAGSYIAVPYYSITT